MPPRGRLVDSKEHNIGGDIYIDQPMPSGDRPLPAKLAAAAERQFIRIGQIKVDSIPDILQLGGPARKRLNQILEEAAFKDARQRPIWLSREAVELIGMIGKLETEPDQLVLVELADRVRNLIKLYGNQPSNLNFLLGVADCYIKQLRSHRVARALQS